MYEIRLASVADIFDNPSAPALFEEYEKESAVEGYGQGNPDRETYQRLYAFGALQPVAAFQNGELVGFLGIMFSRPPHYGTLMASTETIFLSGKARKGGLGLRLIRFAEQVAQERGAQGLMISAPLHGRLVDILPRLGYKATHMFFLKGVNYATH